MNYCRIIYSCQWEPNSLATRIHFPLVILCQSLTEKTAALCNFKHSLQENWPILEVQVWNVICALFTYLSLTSQKSNRHSHSLLGELQQIFRQIRHSTWEAEKYNKHNGWLEEKCHACKLQPTINHLSRNTSIFPDWKQSKTASKRYFAK